MQTTQASQREDGLFNSDDFSDFFDSDEKLATLKHLAAGPNLRKLSRDCLQKERVTLELCQLLELASDCGSDSNRSML